jgi:rhodanese-related sulfurtransferase
MKKTLVLFREMGILFAASTVLGLGYNALSPKALPLVRTNTTIVASDSLIAVLAMANQIDVETNSGANDRRNERQSIEPNTSQKHSPQPYSPQEHSASTPLSASNSLSNSSSNKDQPKDSSRLAKSNASQTALPTAQRGTKSTSTGGAQEQAAPQSSQTVQPTSPVKALEIRFDQAEKLLANPDVLFIDARTTKEYAAGHISSTTNNAINIFTPDFEQSIPRIIGLPRDKPIVAYCGGGACELSHELAQNLVGLGFTHVFVYVGGWNEWLQKHPR